MIWTIWTMHNVRESLEIVDQTQTPRYVLRFEHPALRPRLHTEGFSLYHPYRTSHTGNLHWGFSKYKIGVHNSSLQQTQPLHKRQDTTQITSTLWGIGTQSNKYQPHTRGIRLKATTQQSPLHLEGKAQSHKQMDEYNSWWFQQTTNQFSHKIKIL